MSSLFDTLNFHYALERTERLRAERVLHGHAVAARRAAAPGRAGASAVTQLQTRFARVLSAVTLRLAHRSRGPRLDPGI